MILAGYSCSSSGYKCSQVAEDGTTAYKQKALMLVERLASQYVPSPHVRVLLHSQLPEHASERDVVHPEVEPCLDHSHMHSFQVPLFELDCHCFSGQTRDNKISK